MGDEDAWSRAVGGVAAFDWEARLESTGLASLLVVIEARMGAGLKARSSAEDVLQETLVQAWRDRESCRARGPREMRAWLLTIVDHRLADLADHHAALKRGGGRTGISLGGGGSQDLPASLLAMTTTPSRSATRREQARIMREALDALPEDVREVVRLRVFDQMELADIAARTEMHISSVFRRFRKGLTLYHARLRSALASSPGTAGPGAKTPGADSAPALPGAGPPES